MEPHHEQVASIAPHLTREQAIHMALESPDKSAEQVAYEHERLMRFARAFMATHDTREYELRRWLFTGDRESLNHELWDSWKDVEFQCEFLEGGES